MSISFSFKNNKSKAPTILKRPEPPKPKIDYITSFDQNETKTEEKEAEVVIPVKENYTVAARISKKRKLQENDATSNTDGNSSNNVNSIVDLEKLAIRELIDDGKKQNVDTMSDLSIPLKEKLDCSEFADDNIDYDSIPVQNFGLAMLKGMGWAPGGGIGKKPKIVEVQTREIRARGLGLGADTIKSYKKPSQSEPNTSRNSSR